MGPSNKDDIATSSSESGDRIQTQASHPLAGEVEVRRPPPLRLLRAKSDTFSYSNSSFRNRRRSSTYMGPTPLGLDGKPLKPCLISSASRRISEPSGGSFSDDEVQASKSNRSVSFNDINMRKYERALGDHPCVSSGAPITIGWRFNEFNSIPLDDYESIRGPTLRKEQIRIPAEVRLRMLVDQADVSLRDVKDAELASQRERRQIYKSQKTAKYKTTQKIEELSETLKRKIKRVVTGTTKKRQEVKLWRDAQEVALQKIDQGDSQEVAFKNFELQERPGGIMPPRLARSKSLHL
uniref:Uncharacterized protein n=1 Tax=Ditylum brightwellii TaxID=49249 RepID=A0A7S4SZS3_9STRA|mmetsp:Transcript_61584/g.91531  ORF Transcript_61584/g.91531 Transcript_61584/m.91531 type:complete len:295 (-) Transcript_61584:192-1076(-)